MPTPSTPLHMPQPDAPTGCQPSTTCTTEGGSQGVCDSNRMCQVGGVVFLRVLLEGIAALVPHFTTFFSDNHSFLPFCFRSAQRAPSSTCLPLPAAIHAPPAPTAWLDPSAASLALSASFQAPQGRRPARIAHLRHLQPRLAARNANHAPQASSQALQARRPARCNRVLENMPLMHMSFVTEYRPR